MEILYAIIAIASFIFLFIPLSGIIKASSNKTKINNTKSTIDDTKKNNIKRACWKSIMRNPENYIAEFLRVSGEISQVVEKDDDVGITYIKIGVDEPYYVAIPKEEKIHGGNPLEGDYIDFIGFCMGTTTATTVLGTKVELPLFYHMGSF